MVPSVTDAPDATHSADSGTGTDAAEIPNRDLVELSAHFAHAYLRWLDAGATNGLTYPRLRVLEALHCQGPAKMSTLADSLGMTARNMTALADSLETEGMLRRVAHPTDRRATLLELTPSGLSAADESLAPRLADMGRIFDELTPSARARLRSTLDALVTAIEAGGGSCDG